MDRGLATEAVSASDRSTLDTLDTLDPFVQVRRHYWQALAGDSRSTRTWPRWAPGTLLAELAQSEYLTSDGSPATGSRRSDEDDHKVARMRAAIRSGTVAPPEEAVLATAGSTFLRGAAAAGWPAVVALHGERRTAAALRTALLSDRSPESLALLLDLAAQGQYRSLSTAELTPHAHSPDRRVRHAAWRALAAHAPSARSVLSHVVPTDTYEQLLLEVLLGGDAGRGVRQPMGPGTVVAQSMLLGGLDTPGEGCSGGLGVLLSGLGDALALTDQVAAVITVVTACRSDIDRDPTLLRRRAPGHWVLRLPVDSGLPPGPDEMRLHREALSWWAAHLLGSLGRPVDVLHVRYADDGSIALAEAARRIGAALVFTATPDPHRHIAERHGRGNADPASLRSDLHRVFLADCLVQRADRVLAIARRDGDTQELLRHFPQLESENVSAVPEGIAAYPRTPDELQRRRALLRHIGMPYSGVPGRPLPVLLSVGRLHPVKQQDVLVRAWVASGSHRQSHLVLIGGRPDDSEPAERLMRARIDECLAACPEAAERLHLLPALSNADVRCLERALADTGAGTRARYVCPSVKEEFGLAVLEAMDAGLVVAAPARGGIPNYLVDGDNGLLIDTSTPASLGAGLRRLLDLDDQAIDAMARRAQALVRDTYSAAAMAAALACHYVPLATARRPRTTP
ncbi:glycosyltransferase [Streptomyces sp. MS191]|uniref:glycosyltransferase n=1 Tax=Streptomyces sp. ms191 TaxID=1827978 RepID=UPI00164FDCEF|nr:glycosyltransferase [Streptomyces sp. ms191]